MMREGPLRISRKFSESLLLIIALLAYVASLMLPTWLCHSGSLPGVSVLIIGWVGFIVLEPRWLCNLLPLFALRSFFAGQRIIPWWASVAIAIVSATTLYGPYLCDGHDGALGTGVGPAVGQFFWIASMFLFALWDPRGYGKRRRPRPSDPVKPSYWQLHTVTKLNLQQLTLLCVGYYQLKGFVAQEIGQPSDGSISIALHKVGVDRPIAIVQCRMHRPDLTAHEISPLQELLQEQGVMRGIVWFVPGHAIKPLKASAGKAGIQLLARVAIVERLQGLNRPAQETLKRRLLAEDRRQP